MTSIINLVQQSSSKAHMHRRVKQKSEYRSKLLYIYQTFIDCVSVQYTYFDMSDMTKSNGTLFDIIAFLDIFIHNWRAFMFEVLYIHQTFTDYVSD